MEREVLIRTPDWVKDAVFYQIFPDRFAQSGRLAKPSRLEAWDTPPSEKGFKGGDLLGAAEQLEYLADLGITAIYFNPIFQSAANHRYHTFDYYQVDPLLGGNEAFRFFLDQAHLRGMKVILDGVFNHTSRGFFPFNHVLENQEASIYLDWFNVRGFPLHAFESDQSAQYDCWWNLRELPKLNTDNPAVRQFILDVATHWLRFGIDGWRLDVPSEIRTPGFWESFRDVVKGVNAEAYILGEIWDDAREWLDGDHFDATMNYRFNRACLGFFGAEELDTSIKPGGYSLYSLDGPSFAKEIQELLELYDWEVTQVQFNLLSSHDEPRFLDMVGGNKARLRLATLFQMAFPGAPSVYYGDEIGLRGSGRLGQRGAFPWNRESWDCVLREDFQRFIALRRAHPALRGGEFHLLQAKERGYAFLRHRGEDTMVCCFNAGATPIRLSLDLGSWFPSRTSLKDAWSKEDILVKDGCLEVNLGSLSSKILIG